MSEAAYDGDVLSSVRRLIEEDQLLRDLQQHPGWPVWQRYAERVTGAWQQRMNSGQIEDLNEYKQAAGFLDACRQLTSIPEAVSRSLARAQADVADAEEQEYAPPVYEEVESG